jgi:hypothetical protein
LIGGGSKRRESTTVRHGQMSKLRELRVLREANAGYSATQPSGFRVSPIKPSFLRSPPAADALYGVVTILPLLLTYGWGVLVVTILWLLFT